VSGLGGRFARQGHDLANLFVGDRRRLARAWRVGQTLFYREFEERYRAPFEPAGSPVAGGIYAECFLMGNLSVVASPSAAARIRRARNAICWGVVWRFMSRWSSWRSTSVKVMAGGLGPRIGISRYGYGCYWLLPGPLYPGFT
jgi:hypothetical protein